MRVPAVAAMLCALAVSTFAQKPVRLTAAQVAQEVRDYRTNNEDRIIRELSDFLAIPNIASDTANIQKNADHLVELLEARGIETHLFAIKDRGPVIFGKLNSLTATKTIIFYAHYDGQPVDAAAWSDGGKPFEPTLRSNALEAGGKRIPFPENSPQHPAVYNDDTRIYARSASDDKSPIIALLAALDALRAKNIPLTVNLKVILDGEEEAGSPNLHQSGRPLVFFGNRGMLGFDITTYGAIRALHSGHYGNWAPNPALELSKLLAGMKDETGRVVIPGFYDDVVPLGPVEQKVLEEMPDNDAQLAKDLQFQKPDGGGKKLIELLQLPSLNIRGIRSAYVGEQSQNVVPEKAEASLDVRLVPGEAPDKKYEQILEYIRKQDFFITSAEPTKEERLAHDRVAKVTQDAFNYRASRTAMDLPISQLVISVVEGATNKEAVIAPTLGGSVPMYIFEDLQLPWVGVPIVNADNHQHSSDENLRLGNLWRGIEIYAALLAGL
jgi:acetylornithine deacetylase/succinyl-diaminopimelate desuccinylase-like protein